MGQKIDQISTSISRTKLPDLTKQVRGQSQPAEKKSSQSAAESHQSTPLRSILSELTAGREYSDDKNFKNFTHLARSLEKYFSGAETVDRQTGGKELSQGGLRRIDTDLRKLFKGLGVPPQQAKQLSRAIATAIGQKNVEQLSLPLASSSQLQLETQSIKGNYQANSAIRAFAAENRNGFRLSVTHIRSLDISLNLRNGGYTLTETVAATQTAKSESSAALASLLPVEGDPPSAVSQPISELDDITALINSDSSLREISRTVKQSAITQLAENDNSKQPVTETENRFNEALDRLQQLVSELGEFTEQGGASFESLLQVANLRTERRNENNFLLFTLEAQAPIGLTAIDETGHGTTLYPRPDGSFGKQVETAVKVKI